MKHTTAQASSTNANHRPASRSHRTCSQGSIGLDELNRLVEPHGIEFFDDWIPDLKAAYNLRVVGE